jgi:hypothetical protein
MLPVFFIGGAFVIVFRAAALTACYFTLCQVSKSSVVASDFVMYDLNISLLNKV